MTEIKTEVLKYKNWIQPDMKKTLDLFMRALDEGFKTGVSEKGVSSYVDHFLNGVIDLLDKVANDVSSDKKKNLRASLTNIKRMIQYNSWNPDDLSLDITKIEDKISNQEATVASLKRERSYMDYHKLDDQPKKQRIEHQIQQEQKMILDTRKVLEKIKVSFYPQNLISYFLFLTLLFNCYSQDLEIEKDMCTLLIQEIEASDKSIKDSITKKYNSFKDSYNKINQINHDLLTPQDNMCKRVSL